ncbi:titin homolog [Boleophthalmus pectinirostris]|uniref:titin homolog n=1 Tax=Boleophthalmus pectinirostris TaxID=150288 RepID=UPI00242DD145|nr:titin homolog [Boleophthalmus pectinirostris]
MKASLGLMMEKTGSKEDTGQKIDTPQGTAETDLKSKLIEDVAEGKKMAVTDKSQISTQVVGDERKSDTDAKRKPTKSKGIIIGKDKLTFTTVEDKMFEVAPLKETEFEQRPKQAKKMLKNEKTGGALEKSEESSPQIGEKTQTSGEGIQAITVAVQDKYESVQPLEIAERNQITQAYKIEEETQEKGTDETKPYIADDQKKIRKSVQLEEMKNKETEEMFLDVDKITLEAQDLDITTVRSEEIRPTMTELTATIITVRNEYGSVIPFTETKDEEHLRKDQETEHKMVECLSQQILESEKGKEWFVETSAQQSILTDTKVTETKDEKKFDKAEKAKERRPQLPKMAENQSRTVIVKHEYGTITPMEASELLERKVTTIMGGASESSQDSYQQYFKPDERFEDATAQTTEIGEMSGEVKEDAKVAQANGGTVRSSVDKFLVKKEKADLMEENIPKEQIERKALIASQPEVTHKSSLIEQEALVHALVTEQILDVPSSDVKTRQKIVKKTTEAKDVETREIQSTDKKLLQSRTVTVENEYGSVSPLDLPYEEVERKVYLALVTDVKAKSSQETLQQGTEKVEERKADAVPVQFNVEKEKKAEQDIIKSKITPEMSLLEQESTLGTEKSHKERPSKEETNKTTKVQSKISKSATAELKTVTVHDEYGSVTPLDTEFEIAERKVLTQASQRVQQEDVNLETKPKIEDILETKEEKKTQEKIKKKDLDQVLDIEDEDVETSEKSEANSVKAIQSQTVILRDNYGSVAPLESTYEQVERIIYEMDVPTQRSQPVQQNVKVEAKRKIMEQGEPIEDFSVMKHDRKEQEKNKESVDQVSAIATEDVKSSQKLEAKVKTIQSQTVKIHDDYVSVAPLESAFERFERKVTLAPDMDDAAQKSQRVQLEEPKLDTQQTLKKQDVITDVSSAEHEKEQQEKIKQDKVTVTGDVEMTQIKKSKTTKLKSCQAQIVTLHDEYGSVASLDSTYEQVERKVSLFPETDEMDATQKIQTMKREEEKSDAQQIKIKQGKQLEDISATKQEKVEQGLAKTESVDQTAALATEDVKTSQKFEAKEKVKTVQSQITTLHDKYVSVAPLESTFERIERKVTVAPEMECCRTKIPDS